MPYRLNEIARYIGQMELEADSELCRPQYRSMVNRAYYAAYLTAKRVCQEHDLKGQGKSHECVVDALSKKWARESKQLDQLRILRNNADYYWNRTITWQDAKQAINKSRKIIQNID